MTKTYLKYVRHVSDIPEGPHYAVLQDESMVYDDGYGSPRSPSTSTLSYLNYLAFDSIEKVTEWIREQEENVYYGGKRDFKVVEIRPCLIRRRVEIVVQPDTPAS